MTYSGDDFNPAQLELSKGVDGLNNIADLEDTYVLDARNADLSSPGYVQKRAGYHLYGCKLPIRVKSYTIVGPYNPATSVYQSITFQLDFVGQYNRTLDIWLADSTTNSDYGDARYRYGDRSTELAFARVNGYASTPNTNTVTTDTVLKIDPGGVNECYLQPVAVFDNNTFLIPLHPLLEAGISPNAGGGAAVSYTTYFGNGPTFKRWEWPEVTNLTKVNDTTVEISFDDVTASDVNLNDLVKFEVGLTNSSSTSRSGYISDINTTTNVATATLYSALPALASAYDSLCRIYYASANSSYFKSQSLEFLLYDVQTAGDPREILSCNLLKVQNPGLIISGPAGTGTYEDIGFMYGTDISCPSINTLAYFYDTVLEKNRIVTGYDGNIFVETDPSDRVYNTQITPVVANQTIAMDSSGVGNITVPDETYYEDGDTVTLVFSDTNLTQSEYTFIASSSGVAGSVVLTNTDYASTNITVPNNSKLIYTRTNRKVLFRKETYDDDPIVFAGCTFQIQVGDQYPVHRITGVFYDQGATNFLETVNDVIWSSDSTIKIGSIFMPVNYAESSSLDNYEPITQSYFPETLIDLSSALIDRTVYIAAQKDGIWKYNGSELINMYLPAPTTPLLTNIPGSAGNLIIVEDANGDKFGKYYNIILTYSYFEFANGILTEVESGISPFDSGAIRAEPASDGSFNSNLIEIQVKSIPRGIGLPADSMLLNVYRSVDGTVDGIQPDGQTFYREASVTNNPDTPYNIAYAGTLTSFLLRANGKPLYASISSEAADEEGRNIRTPPLANHIINFQDRLIAVNGREKPFFNYSCNTVFDSSGDWAADAVLRFVPSNPNDTEYRFATIPADDSTTTGSYVTPDGETISYQVLTSENYDIDLVDYLGNRSTIEIPKIAVPLHPAGSAIRVVLRSANRDGIDTVHNGFKIDSQIFTSSTTTPNTRLLGGVWTDPSYVSVALPNRFLAFASVENSTVATNLQVIITKTTIELIGTTAGASAYDGEYIVILGLGTLPQLRDLNDGLDEFGDPTGRIYDIDTEIVWLATAVGGLSDYTLVPHKITGFVGTSITTEAIKPYVGQDVVNIATTTIEGVSHGPIEIFGCYATASGDVTTATPIALEPSTASLTLPIGTPDLGLVAGDYVTVSGTPTVDAPSKIPSVFGVDYNKRLEVSAYSYPGAGFPQTVTVIIDKPKAQVEAYAGKQIAGKLASDTLVSFTSTYMEILYPSAATAVSTRVEQGQWVYVIAKTPDTLQHSLQISGWFKVYQVSAGAGWATSASAGSFVGIRLYMDGDAIEQSTLIGLTNVKIVIGRENSGTPAIGLRSYVPVPVPASETGDVTGNMFGPLDGLTPYEKVIKRLGNAVSTVMEDHGFAYWGADPGQIAEEYPINGFKFVTHKWPYNKYDENLIEYPNNKYSLAFDAVANYYEWLVDGGQGTSDGTLITADLLEQRYPSRCWYTTPGNRVFRDISFGDVLSEDGEEIIGAIPFEEYFLVFKESQIFKLKITPEGLLVDRVQARVGAVSKKNIIPTDSGAMFLSKNGFFYTDGNSVKKVVRLNRIFNDYVKPNYSLFPFTCGVYDPTNYFLRLGAPVADSIDGAYTSNDRHVQLSFNRTQDPAGGISGGGWSIGTNIPANVWLHVNDSTYFGASSGGVYRMRQEFAASRYRDDESAISYRIDTRYYDFGSADHQKFVREIVMQLDTKYDNGITTYTTWNFRTDYHLLGSFSLDQSALAIADDSYNERYDPSAKYLESRRQTVDPMRSTQLGFRLENTVIDQNGGIHGLWAHVNKIGAKGIRQR